MKACFVNAPAHYGDLLGPLPEPLSLLKRPGGDMDFVHFFVRRARRLRDRLPALKSSLGPQGMLWMSWPKKASSLSTEVAEADIRSAGIHAGLVDVKICAVDDDWSGLKFVYRLEDRW
ncbi:MAG: DUF3052 family protein [Acidobacteria bacterium]|nr:DUF3052 family protein [Acidobacteriota bacterium]